MKAIPCIDYYAVCYGKLLGILEGRIESSSLADNILVESDSLATITNLEQSISDLPALGVLASHYLCCIKRSSFEFSHGYQTDNCVFHLLANIELHSNVVLG